MIAQSTDTAPALLRSDTVKAYFGGISDMTLWRWVKHRGFPAPIKIAGRNFWEPAAIERWWREQA